MNKQWFIVYCKSREENRAVKNLHNQGINSFFPKIKNEKIYRGKKTVSEEALFPSYLFIHIDQEDSRFSRVRSTRGINDFIRFGGKITTVPTLLIEQLKKLCYVLNDFDADKKSLFKEGDKIEVMQGAFKGATAIFASDDGLERSMLLLKVLNQEKSISFCNKEIKKI
ncbi:MAG: transcription/translation regulatory transformer protein RfaH [Alteromonadales bacterium]|nr:transcription/translation regulatory transformer protein RfaH [Alteromonadales bacterium]